MTNDIVRDCVPQLDHEERYERSAEAAGRPHGEGPGARRFGRLADEEPGDETDDQPPGSETPANLVSISRIGHRDN